MTKVEVFKRLDGVYTGIKCSGHAGYADKGQDIVCAAISVLVTNTLNSIEKFSSAKLDAKMDDDSAVIEATIRDADVKVALLIDSMILGLQQVQSTYGKEFLTLDVKIKKEV